MDLNEKIIKINKVVREYFAQNKNVEIAPAKDLMPLFIGAGIFIKDQKNGLPIRKLLRELDKENNLGAITSALGEKKNTNTNWFFIRPNFNKPINKVNPPKNILPSITVKRQSSKELILPDLIKPKLDIVFCGMAVGNKTAKVKSYYAGSGNKFYSILAEIGLTDNELKPEEYNKLLDYNLGLTDLVKNKSGNDSDLVKSDFDVPAFVSKILENKPRYVCFNGKASASVLKYGTVNKTTKIDYGFMSEEIGNTKIFVAPSTSGSASRYWDSTYWHKLAELILDKNK